MSLSGPFEDAPVVLMLFRAPVYALVGSAFVAPFQPGFRFMTPVALAAVLFAISPLTLVGQVSRRRAVTQRFLSLGLLGVWVFPIVVELVATPQEKQPWGFQHVAWGYYLYATAHTLTFVAVQMASHAALMIDSRQGFPVVQNAAAATGADPPTRQRKPERLDE
jgi:hypothetical protein